MRRFQIVKRAMILRRNVLVVSALDEGNNSLLVDDNFSMEGWRCCFDNLYACKNQQVQSGDNEGKGRKRKQRMAGLERLSHVTDRNFLFQEVHVGASFLPRLRGGNGKIKNRPIIRFGFILDMFVSDSLVAHTLTNGDSRRFQPLVQRFVDGGIG